MGCSPRQARPAHRRAWLPGACGALWLCGLLLFPGSAALRADPRQALQQAALLVQQGRLEEADQQAQLAVADPETRAAAYSVLGAIRFQQKRFGESASFLQKA